jgi:hypothetical protein
VGTSIPATEHSVMTSWPSERAAIANMIHRFGSGIFACVMDSYDYAAALSEVGGWGAWAGSLVHCQCRERAQGGHSNHLRTMGCRRMIEPSCQLELGLPFPYQQLR